jgi:hypothetical protein
MEMITMNRLNVYTAPLASCSREASPLMGLSSLTRLITVRSLGNQASHQDTKYWRCLGIKTVGRRQSGRSKPLPSDK